jgi:UDP-N-acetylglucosamine:LPS N-acetylglucosamine transferase
MHVATKLVTRSEVMKILIVSVNAGGGHTTAMHSLLLSLQQFAPYVNVEYFTSPNRVLEHMHRLAYTKGAYLYNAFYKATAQSTALRKAYFGVTSPSIRSFYRELLPLLGEYDAVLSTHFMQTYALLKAKHTLGVPTRIIAYVPDFDHSCIHVPGYAGLCVDAVLAQGTRLSAKLARLYNFAPERMQRAGFLPRAAFTDVRALSAAQARQRVAALDIPLVAHLRADAFTVVVTGGAYWSMGLYSVLKHLASHPSNGATAVFTQPANQILVVCGHNAKAYRAYSHLRHTTGLNVMPLPFLPAEQLAAVFRSADATVLASVAPATLYELMEAKAGPLLVHRINPGPEQDNLAFLLQHRLAHYLPNPQALRDVLLRLSTSPLYRAHWQQVFWQAAEHERAAARERARQNTELIVHVAARQEACPSGWRPAAGHVGAS